MTTNRPEFTPHDDFIFEHKKIGKVTREEFIKYIRSSHKHMRKLSEIIQQYNQTIDGYLEEWDGRFESFDDDVKDLLGRWINDGTMDHIINENLMSIKADKTYVDDLNQNVTAQLEEIHISVTQFGAVGDNVTDDTEAIQATIQVAKEQGGIVYLPKGRYKISSSLLVPNGVSIIGAGEMLSTLFPADNTFSAIKTTENTYRNRLSNFAIYGGGLEFGENNAGIEIGDHGTGEMEIDSVRIWGMKYGIKTGNTFWMSTIRRVRAILCDISFYGQDSRGTSINNLFDQFYSDRAATGGIRLSGWKNSEFLNCNFGGRKGQDDKTTYAVYLASTCVGMKMTSCNFEHHVISSNGMIRLWSNSRLSIHNSNVFNCDSADTSKAYAFYLRDLSRLSLYDCNIIQQGDNLRGVMMINDSEYTVHNSDDFFSDISNASSKKGLDVNSVVSKVDSLLPVAVGESTIGAGVVIDSGIGERPRSIQLTVLTDGDTASTITANVSEIYNNGRFKVRFTNIDTGTENYGTHTVFWTVW